MSADPSAQTNASAAEPVDVANKASHDAGVPKPLVDYMAEGWAEPAAPDLTPAAFAEHTARRRAAVSALFPGDTLVVPTGGLKVRNNDCDYRFRPGTDFFWLTGSMEPDSVLVMTPDGEGHTATLYQAPRSDRSSHAFFTDRRYGELWVGPRPGLDETAARLGLPTASVDELPAVLDGLSAPRVVRGIDPVVDAALPASDDDARGTELAAALSELRLVKDSHEVAMLQQACDATTQGFTDVVRELAQAVATSERWIEGTFYRRARVEGYDVGYDTIAAAGNHACTLHWVRNDGPVRPGELLLLDAGVESTELYTADVTRTLPVDGEWTEAQREVYSVVLAAQEAGIAAVKPGADFLDAHKAAMAVCAQWLLDTGILTGTLEEVLDPERQLYRRYTLHGVSHMLGLDVHDCANARDSHYRNGTLAEGYCLTVEPGLYFQADDLTVPEKYRGIGVRIEDDILVTADGNRNLSAALPRDPDEIVAWMSGLTGA